LAIEFKLLDYDQGVDKLIKKSWPLRWRSKLGHYFLTINFFFCVGDQILVIEMQPDVDKLTKKS
jgi:hypothetical protein